MDGATYPCRLVHESRISQMKLGSGHEYILQFLSVLLIGCCERNFVYVVQYAWVLEFVLRRMPLKECLIHLSMLCPTWGKGGA